MAGLVLSLAGVGEIASTWILRGCKLVTQETAEAGCSWYCLKGAQLRVYCLYGLGGVRLRLVLF